MDSLIVRRGCNGVAKRTILSPPLGVLSNYSLFTVEVQAARMEQSTEGGHVVSVSIQRHLAMRERCFRVQPARDHLIDGGRHAWLRDDKGLGHGLYLTVPALETAQVRLLRHYQDRAVVHHLHISRY